MYRLFYLIIFHCAAFLHNEVQKLIFVELQKFSLDTWNSGKTIYHFFTIDSLGNWSSNPVFVKISSSISMDLKNISKRWNFISINSNQLGDSVQTKENLPNICGNSAFSQLGNTSIEDLYILLTNTASQFENEGYFECLKNLNWIVYMCW